jgi:hypothetical protein
MYGTLPYNHTTTQRKEKTMKAGKTLVELATEVERQEKSKQDFVLPTSSMVAIPSPAHKSIVMEIPGQDVFLPTDVAHQQIATHTNIPAAYYNRMLDNDPAIVALNINHWLRQLPERRMVRTIEDTNGVPRMRALLSDRYRRLDNYDLMSAILPSLLELREQGDVRIESADITDKKLYIKVVTPRIQGEIKRGDVVQAGAVISNSEVGQGAISVQLLIFRLVCLNGSIMPDYGTRRNHVGRIITDSAGGDGSGILALLSDETVMADDAAFFLKVRDVVRGTLLDGTMFNAALTKMQEAASAKIEGDPVKSVEVLAKKYALNQTERNGVLRNLIEGSDLSLYGLSNAITREAQDVGSYDRATELEALGGNIITLSRSDWREIATAA